MNDADYFFYESANDGFALVAVARYNFQRYMRTIQSDSLENFKEGAFRMSKQTMGLAYPIRNRYMP